MGPRSKESGQQKQTLTYKGDLFLKKLLHASKKRDRVIKERDHAFKEWDSAFKERDLAFKERDHAYKERDGIREKPLFYSSKEKTDENYEPLRSMGGGMYSDLSGRVIMKFAVEDRRIIKMQG